MFEDLRGRHALITGSTSGIGLAMAEGMARLGMDVTMNGFGDAGEIEANRARIAEEHGVTARYDGADMTKPDEIARMMKEAEGAMGRIDLLVNNAGIQKVAPIDEYDDAKWDAIIAINLSSAYHTIKRVIPGMKERGFGRIVNVASGHGLVASPYKAAYVASKHGVVGLTKAVALEVAERGITCNAICPGYTLTPLVEAQIADTAKARGMSEDKVVSEVMLKVQPTKEFVTYDQLVGMLAYLASDVGGGATGAAFPIDGGWTAH